MENKEFLKSKQKYVINKVNKIMKGNDNYDIKFRNNKKKTAGTVLEDPDNKHKTFIFSNYWIQAFTQYELDNLIKHECAHALSDYGHSSKFKKMCKKLNVPKRWQVPKVNKIKVYEEML